MDMADPYVVVTEVAGEEITNEQLWRLYSRYQWAGQYCRGKDVIEVACGSGPGLGYLQSLSKTLVAGDISPTLVSKAKSHYKERVDLRVFDAQKLPFEDRSADVILICEAIYYLPEASLFIDEAKRVLRPGGCLLIVTANKDLYDFNPSPFSTVYYGVCELKTLLSSKGFSPCFFGGTKVDNLSLRQKILRPIKKVAVFLNLIPKTMGGKKWLKKLVFGSLVRMPAEIVENPLFHEAPKPISSTQRNLCYKVIYCAAYLNKEGYRHEA